MKSVLVIRFSSIGDVVLCSPVVRVLKNTGFNVTVITKKGFKALWKNNPNVHELLLVDDLSESDLNLLDSKKFDYVVDLHNNRWSNRIKNRLKVPSYTLSKSNINKALLVWTKLKVFKSSHIVDRYLETLLPLTGLNDSEGLEFFEDEPSDAISKYINEKYAVFVIGGQHKGKMMSAERIKELCNAIEIPLLLLGGPEDETKGEWIESGSGKNIINLAGKLSLMDSVNLIKYSKFVISHDTGLMHIASAYQKNIISLWGATTPELGFGPYKPGNKSVILEEPHILRPSSKLGKQRLFKKINFIDRIPLETILREMNNLWT